jgi:outer membrane protein assembly factor BamB
VAAVEKSITGGATSVVITRWSDGEIVALSAEKGDVVWQQHIEPAAGEAYNGRRTGARTMYEPDDLFVTASTNDQRTILMVTGKDVVQAIDPWEGTIRWTRVFTEAPGCRQVDWTGETTYIVKETCSKPAVLEVYDASSGTLLSTWRPPGASIGPDSVTNWFLEPASCVLGRSGCKLFKAAATGDAVSFTEAASGVGKITPTYWRAGRDGAVTPEPFADKDNVVVVGDTLLQQVVTNYIWAFSRATGKRIWMSEVAGDLIGADDHNVYLVNREFQLLVLNLVTGAVTSSTELRIRPEDRWLYQQAYLHGGYLALERLQTTRESDVDEKYYFTINPIVLVGI